MRMRHTYLILALLGLFVIGGIACPGGSDGGDEHDHSEHEHGDGNNTFDDDDSAGT